MSAANGHKTILNFAVIGCGRVSQKHLEAITSGHMPGRLVAVSDLNEAKARAASDRYKAPFYTDYHAMLQAHPEIDVIDVLTPSGYHARHVQDLAPYGRHIVVEKPMALRVDDCDEMIAACRKHSVRLFVVKQNRFNPAVVAARAALEEGRFGRMVMGTVCVRWKRDQRYYDQDDWRGTWALDGGVTAQQASHHLDLLQWFMGPVETVQCQMATRLMQIEVEDTAAAIMRFQSGALGIFEATVASRPEDLGGTLSLLGEHGSILIGGLAVNKIAYWKFDDPLPEDESMPARFSQDVPSVYGYGHLPYLHSVASSLLNGTPAPVDGEEGRRNVQILTALYESASCGGATVRPGQQVCHTRIGCKSA